LTVREDAHIVSVNGTLDETLSVFEHFLLCTVHAEHGVEGVIFRPSLLADSEREVVMNVERHGFLLGVFELHLRERTDTAVDTNFTLQVFQLVQQLLSLDLLFLVFGCDNIELSGSLLKMLLQQTGLFFQGSCLTSGFRELLDLLLEFLVFGQRFLQLLLHLLEFFFARTGQIFT